MKALLSLVGRNNKIYYRDKAAVFFSILSAVIVVGLFVLFLKDIYVNDMVSSGLSELDGEIIAFTWLLCGIIGLNAFTVPATLVSTFIYDKESGIIKDFLVSPVSLIKLMFSYIISGVVASSLINSILLIILIGYQLFYDIFQITYSQILTLIILYLLSSITFTTVSFCVAVFIKSSKAFSGFTALCSAFLGFLSGVYMPVGNFSGAVKNIISIFPITQYSAF